MDEDAAGVPPRDGRDRRTALSTLAHDLVNLASRLMVLSANLQVRLTDAAERDETAALLGDSTHRLQEIARKLREMDRDG